LPAGYAERYPSSKRKKFLQKIECGCRFGKGFSAKIKLFGGFERKHLGKDDTIVMI
jgi:hypothetical protein